MTWRPIFDWDNEGWRDRAACRHSDAELFFPVGSTSGSLDEIKAVKSVCRSCPVQAPCLQFALQTNQEAGIWGGMDEEERRRLRAAWRAGRQPAKRSVMT
jgi:WhiB family redox-sensing transcriptional regulator